MNHNFTVIPYETADGKIPYDDFLGTQRPEMIAKILRAVDLLEEFGNDLREPHSKPLGNGIFELRIKFGSDISRVLYFFMIGKKIILTHGFAKKEDKTPKSEIDKAKRYRDDWKKRYGNDK